MPKLQQFERCEILADLNTWWLSGGAGHGDCYRLIYEHMDACEVCWSNHLSATPPSPKLVYRLENGKFYDTIETEPVYIPPDEREQLAARLAEMEMTG